MTDPKDELQYISQAATNKIQEQKYENTRSKSF